MKNTSDGFKTFMQESGKTGEAFMEFVQKSAAASALDKKTAAIAYISVLAALGADGGLPFHVKHAKQLGVTREEVKSAMLVGLPVAGLKTVAYFDIALKAYDEE